MAPSGDWASCRTAPEAMSTTSSRPSRAATAAVDPSGAAASSLTSPSSPAASQRGRGGPRRCVPPRTPPGHRPGRPRSCPAAGVADPDDLAVADQHPGHPGPDVRLGGSARAGPSRWVSQCTVPADLDHAGQAGIVAGQVAQVVGGRDRRGRAVDAEPRLTLSGRGWLSGARLSSSQSSPRHWWIARGAVRPGLAGVPAVVVGVAEQAGTVQPARVAGCPCPRDRTGTPPVTDQHGAVELPGQAGQEALERGAARRGPRPARGAAPVPLQEAGPVPAAVEQRPGALSSRVTSATRPKTLRLPHTPIHRDRVRPALPLEGLAGRAPPASTSPPGVQPHTGRD